MARWPVQSPYENTRNLYRALSAKAPTLLYHLSERVECDFAPADVFIGHPMFPHKQGQYGVTELSFRSKKRPAILALITPLHCNVEIETPHINRDFLDAVDLLMARADVLFAIMGHYWWDQWDASPYAHWKKKMRRLDMAVDVTRYPRLKAGFNRPGERGYLFIGSSDDQRKGASIFSRLMSELGDYPRGWIGSGPEISNVPRIAHPRTLSPDFMKSICERFDFFVSPALADPNPTTILENMAWGLPVVCTPQSGYYGTSFRRSIHADDLSSSVDVLRQLQFTAEAELLAMTNEARVVVETQYTWDRFTSTVVSTLGL